VAFYFYSGEALWVDARQGHGISIRRIKKIVAKGVSVQLLRNVPDRTLRRYMVPYCGDIRRFLEEMPNRLRPGRYKWS